MSSDTHVSNVLHDLYLAAVVADSLLIILPIQAVRRLKNEPSLQRRLTFIFTASAITSVVTLTNAILNFLDVGFGLTIISQVEVRIYSTTSCFFTNFSVYSVLGVPSCLQLCYPHESRHEIRLPG